MKHTFYLLGLSAVFLLFVTACQTGSSSKSAKPEREELHQKIKSLEQELFGKLEKQPSTEKTTELKGFYLEYANYFPDDSIAPEYLFRAADLAVYLKKYNKAIALYQRIHHSYPNFARAPECLFLTGWVYDEHIKNYDKAEKSYRAFIEQYPESQFREAAEVSLEYLGRSPEEIMEEILKNKREEE